MVEAGGTEHATGEAPVADAPSKDNRPNCGARTGRQASEFCCRAALLVIAAACPAVRAADPASPAAAPSVESIVITGRKLNVETLIDCKVYSVATDVQATFGSVSKDLDAVAAEDLPAKTNGMTRNRASPRTACSRADRCQLAGRRRRRWVVSTHRVARSVAFQGWAKRNRSGLRRPGAARGVAAVGIHGQHHRRRAAGIRTAVRQRLWLAGTKALEERPYGLQFSA